MADLLVHICCAPDALYFLKRLKEDFASADMVGFFYDPNIHPYEEYRLRLVETRRICRELGIPLIEGEYDPENWMERVRGLEEEPERGERCSVCFDIRLERSAQLAKDLGCSSFTTTLLMSPKKKFSQLRESGERVASSYGLRFIAVDYRKGGGTQEMFRLSRDYQIYMQDYCGCIYALAQQKGEGSLHDLTSFGKRPPGSREETLFIKEVREEAEGRGFKTREIDFPFLGWRVLEGGILAGDKPVPSLVKTYSASIRGKVKGKLQRVSEKKFVLGKQFVTVELVRDLRDIPLEEFSGLIPPTFYVDEKSEDLLINSKITATLRTEFVPMTSRVLIIGDSNAGCCLTIPADTLQDGRGWKIGKVLEILELRKEDIKKGRVSVALAGGFSVLRSGLKVLEDNLRSEIEILGYPS